eukprot:1258759-Rhodomonas_salina.1
MLMRGRATGQVMPSHVRCFEDVGDGGLAQDRRQPACTRPARPRKPPTGTCKQQSVTSGEGQWETITEDWTIGANGWK